MAPTREKIYTYISFMKVVVFFLQNAETMVARWEENKKWQKMVDRLKGRVKEKDEQIEKLTKSNELLKHGLERCVTLLILLVELILHHLFVGSRQG